MKHKFQKIFCATAALCLFGTALASVSKVDAYAQETQAYNFEEIMAPVWEGDISYMETVLPVENPYGGMDPIQLLYPIEEVIEVKNAELNITYKKGVDYAVAGGKLLIADDGAIPTLAYSEFHPLTGENGFQDEDGGYICFHEGDYFHKQQIVVTYTHTANYDGYVPEEKGDLLPNVTDKLQKGTGLDLLVLGDSISVGANSSGFIGAAPHMPTYPELFAAQLENTYGGKINLINPSVGGMGIDWGLNKIDEILSEQTNLDLAVIAFGMNDGSMAPAVFAQKTLAAAEKVKEKFPNAEVMLVATMLPNPKAKFFNLNQSKFYDAMVEMCQQDGIAVVNVSGVHQSLLKRKSYSDMTGNNVNHPNDYLARVYAQTLFATLQVKQVEVEVPTIGAESDSQQDSQAQNATIVGLLSGCTSTASIALCGAMALGAATIALKKKKDD